MNLTMSEQLMHSTIRIEILTQNGAVQSTGTGFFFLFGIKGENNVPVLVTNKHVIKEAELGRLVFTVSNSSNDPQYGEKFTYTIADFERSFILHPDSSVDICIMPINPIIEDVRSRNDKKLFTISLNESVIPGPEQLKKLSALEEVIMIGYPNGLWDEVNNLPIIRRGVTAIHPKFDYNNKTDIVIDIACFPGSSGSPVCIFNQGSYSNENGITIGSRLILLGILYAGPQQTAIGEIQTVDIPTAVESIARTNVMINLGYAVKSSRLLDFKPILNQLVK